MISFGPIEFATPALAQQFDTQITPATRAILLELARWSKVMGYPAPYVTSLRRAPIGKFSYHHVGRAFDLRTEHGWYTPEQRAEVEKFIRENWPPKWRKCDVLYHNAGSGLHLHLELEEMK